MASEQHCLGSLVPLPRHDCVYENPVSHARTVRRRHHEPMLCIKLDAEILGHLRTRDTSASHEPNARASSTPVLLRESSCHALVDLLRGGSDHYIDGHRAPNSTRGFLPSWYQQIHRPERVRDPEPPSPGCGADNQLGVNPLAYWDSRACAPKSGHAGAPGAAQRGPGCREAAAGGRLFGDDDRVKRRHVSTSRSHRAGRRSLWPVDGPGPCVARPRGVPGPW